jgi:hypothetical protein
MYVGGVEVANIKKQYWEFAQNTSVWMHVHVELKVPTSDNVNFMSRVGGGGSALGGYLKGKLSEVKSLPTPSEPIITTTYMLMPVQVSS